MYTRTLIVLALFFLIAVVAAVWLYSQMPARVPVQWDRLSHVRGTMPRFWGAALPALITLALGLLTPLLPLLSLRRFEITLLVHVYGIVMLAIQGVLLVGGLCVLLMVLGNYMGQLRKNFFIGIRTPWTLLSETVWERTHRLGSWLFMLAGLVMVIGALIGASAWLVPTMIVAAVLIPCVYSFWIYRRLDRAV
jgi:uncharacterized membrane protein